VGRQRLGARPGPLVLAGLVGATIPLLWRRSGGSSRRGGPPRFWRVWRYTVLAVAAWSVLPSVVGVGVGRAVFAASGVGNTRAAASWASTTRDRRRQGPALHGDRGAGAAGGGVGGGGPLVVMALALGGLLIVGAAVAWARRRAGSPFARKLAGLPGTPRLLVGVGLACAVKWWRAW
jgi:hypothetical protein